MKKTFSHLNRRQALKMGVAGSAALASPLFFVSNANAYTNAPTGDTVMLGFNVPQTGAYADEGADELRAYRLAVKHLNDGGGGMLDTLTIGGESSALPQVEAASGAKYSDGTLTWWEKGDTGLVMQGDSVSLRDCRRAS